jgi:hypothetical protein
MGGVGMGQGIGEAAKLPESERKDLAISGVGPVGPVTDRQ